MTSLPETLTQVRFVKQDDFWLSPDYLRDSCHITQLIYNPSKQTKKLYYHGYHRAMRKYHGRPHWGKELEMSHKEVEELYPKLEEFLSVRKKMDPDKQSVPECWLVYLGNAVSV